MPYNIMSGYTLLKPRIIIKRFIQTKSTHSDNKAQILNLSMQKLLDKERKQLEMELQFSFLDKNKHLQKQLAANFETCFHRASNFANYKNLEDFHFHFFLRAQTHISIKSLYATKDFTNCNLKNIIKSDRLVVLSGDQDSCVVIIQWEDYDNKF